MSDTTLLPVRQLRLANEASWEVKLLAGMLAQIIDDQADVEQSKLWCGLLTRIQNLAEAISACADEDPAANYGKTLNDLQKIVMGSVAL